MSGNRDTAIIRFGSNTPFFPLSMTYGMFVDPSTRMWFLSLDHYIAYEMLCRDEHRREIMGCPNGWIAKKALERILTEAHAVEGNPVVRPDWEDVGEDGLETRDRIMLQGLRWKYGQHSELRALLLRTRDRRISDESRSDELHWCDAFGRGRNRHGKLSEMVRDAARADPGSLEFRGE